MTQPKIIVIEDENNLRRFVRLTLEADECDVFEADCIKRGLIETATRRPDLVVLDLGLPDGDGIDFIRDVRTWSNIPIIVLSARTAEKDKVMALDVGADDFLTKPFGAAELSARVRAHLRRTRHTPTSSPSVVHLGNILLDFSKRRVEKNGGAVHLTQLEFRLLAYLVSNPDCVHTHRQLLKAVWGPSHTEDTHYVRIYMRHLRQKLEDDPTQPQHFLTESGIGYRCVL